MRGYGPAGDEGGDEAEAEARHGAAHHPTFMQSFAARVLEPEQQTLEGFAVYESLDDGTLDWVADLITLGHALDVASGMAGSGSLGHALAAASESGGASLPPRRAATGEPLSPTDRAMTETMEALIDDPAAPMAFQPAPGDCTACGGSFEEIDYDGLCAGCRKRNELYDALN
ncbi:MAG: hypothetical protein ACODAA_00830, partial [Gemmatimonadota bacterium]